MRQIWKFSAKSVLKDLPALPHAFHPKYNDTKEENVTMLINSLEVLHINITKSIGLTQA